jgi:hypothetical protein
VSRTERRRSVSIEYDGIVGLGDLEEAALAFARSAPGELVAEVIEWMVAELIDTVVGPFGVPWPTEEQLEAPWGCTGCASRRGFRRRGFRPKRRTITTAAGRVAFRSQQLECLGCSRRFAPAAELLGLRPTPTPHRGAVGAGLGVGRGGGLRHSRRACWRSWRAWWCRPAASAGTCSPPLPGASGRR